MYVAILFLCLRKKYGWITSVWCVIMCIKVEWCICDFITSRPRDMAAEYVCLWVYETLMESLCDDIEIY